MDIELKNNHVVQANELVRQTNWTMSKTPLKLFKALVASIDTTRPPEDGTITVKKADLVRFFDGNLTNYDYLKAKLRELITAVKVIDDEKRQDEKVAVFGVADAFSVFAVHGIPPVQ